MALKRCYPSMSTEGSSGNGDVPVPASEGQGSGGSFDPGVSERGGMVKELQVAHNSIEAGHEALGRISGANDFYTAPLLLYSYGFERLLKIALYLRRGEVRGKRPKGTKIRAFKHNIQEIHRALLEECKAGPQPNLNDMCHRLVAEDREWLTKNPLAAKFIEVLEAFGSESRYHHLNRVLGLDSETKDATDLMTELENDVGEAYSIHPPRALDASLDPYYREVSRHIVGLSRRYYRAIARLFLYEYLGSIGGQLSAGPMFELAMMKDHELEELPG